MRNRKLQNTFQDFLDQISIYYQHVGINLELFTLLSHLYSWDSFEHYRKYRP